MKVGFLGIMQELYDNSIPNITNIQSEYAKKIISKLETDKLEFVFPRACRNRDDIEKTILEFESNKEICGVMIVMLTYGPALRTINALKNTSLPILVANTQPEAEVTEKWNMVDLTLNQGIHGAQDMANTLLRLNLKYKVISGDWQSNNFISEVREWCNSVIAIKTLQTSKVAVFGQMPGMGDILTDNHAFMQNIGVQVDHISTGRIYQEIETITPQEIEKAKLENEKNFIIDTKLSQSQYEYAIKLELAIEKFLQKNKYQGFSIYFDALKDDLRFKQIHMLAASNLMAKGYGYAAEGDSNTASLLLAALSIDEKSNFTEMYAHDFKLGAFLQSHMGEGNWKSARKDKKPKLIDRELGIGGLENPPTVLFQGEVGEATLVSLVSLRGNSYRLVVSLGKILNTPELPNLEMPYFFFKPNCGLEYASSKWLEFGGTHHQVVNLGDKREFWKNFCNILNIEYKEILL